MPLLSIVVPCHNSASFIAETVASVQRQTIADWELILVNDGSSDQTWEIISNATAHDSRIRAFHQSGAGTCRTRNRGFQECSPSSPYLFFLDHDDQIDPRFIEIMCGYLFRHPDVGLLACQYEDVSQDGRRLGTGKVIRWKPGKLVPRQMRSDEVETPFVTFFSSTGRGPFAVYRRSIYEQTTGWEINFWPDEDTDMFCQMALLAKVHFLPDRLYLKRLHAAQGSRNLELLAAGARAFRKKWDNLKFEDGRRSTMLRQALHYFYRRHLPYWNLITAAQAVKCCVKMGAIREPFSRFVSNIISACRGIFSPLPPVGP